MKILVTGAAGFIGSKVSKVLAEQGHDVIGLDSINDYYDVSLKYNRIKNLIGINKEDVKPFQSVQSNIYPNCYFIKLNLEDNDNLQSLFKNEKFDRVCNLAAQPGIRYSLENPHAYINSNIIGFLNLLECCRQNKVQHLIYASSSSVYGMNSKVPFSEKDNVDHPISLYAATKKSNELMAHVYSNLYSLPTTGLRLFTVYGSWGRPDMAPFLFTDAILKERPINIFNNGDMLRDFTHIDDVVEGITRIINIIPTPNPHFDSSNPTPESSSVPYRIYNIGNSTPVKLMEFIQAIEAATGKPAVKNFLPMQSGDVYQTFADTSDLETITGFRPQIKIESGIREFIDWYKNYYPEK